MKFALGYPTGVPLGGIGTGMIELRSDGRIGTVGCNNNWSAPFTETPGCFFAVGMKNFEGKEEIRLLRDGDEGAWKGMDRIRFRAEYPFAKVVYACCNPVFETELTAFCPNIPHENEDSSIPGARFEFVFRNSERKPLSLRLYLSWEHLSGCGALPDRTWRCDRTGNRIVPVSEEKWEGLVFLPGEGEKELPNAAGEWMVRLLGLESVLPEDMVRSALMTIYENNGDTSRYALAPIKVTKEGRMVQRDCAEQAWPQYTMVFADCLAMYLGMEEGMANLRHFDRIVTELIQAPCTTTLWHNCVTGLPNWGGIDRYMNTPSIWFVLNAMTGFHPQLDENAIKFDADGYGFRSAAVLPFIASAFWAKAEIGCGRAEEKYVKISFDKVFLGVRLEKLRIGGCRKVLAFSLNGKEIPFEEKRESGREAISFEGISIVRGDEIVIIFSEENVKSGLIV